MMCATLHDLANIKIVSIEEAGDRDAKQVSRVSGTQQHSLEKAF